MASVTTRIGPAVIGRRMTSQEFTEAEEEPGCLYELARGVLEVSEIPDIRHAYLVCYLIGAVAAYRQAHPDLIDLYGGHDHFRPWIPDVDSGRHPDLAVALRTTPRGPKGRRPPALAIEIVSPGAAARKRDYVTKRQEYLRFGLLEYWIVDLEGRRVLVLIRDGDAWVERPFGPGQVAEGRALPGFAVPVDELFAAADAATEDED